MADPTELVLSQYGANASSFWPAGNATVTHFYDPSIRPYVTLYADGGLGSYYPHDMPPVHTLGGNATIDVNGSISVAVDEAAHLAAYAEGGDGSHGGDANILIRDFDIVVGSFESFLTAQGGDAASGFTDGDANVTVRDTTVSVAGMFGFSQFSLGISVSSFATGGATSGTSSILLDNNSWTGGAGLDIFGLLFSTNEPDSTIDSPASVTLIDNHIDLMGGFDLLTIQVLRGTYLVFVSGNVIDGGSGFDALGFESDHGVDINLPEDGFVNFEYVQGSASDDNFVDGDAATIFSPGTGTNTVDGEGGDDTFILAFGNDDYDGGDGFDTLDLSGSSVGATVLFMHNVTADGTAVITSIERIIGTMFDDDLQGDFGACDLVGGDGDDILRGSLGSDLLEGGLGDDTLESWVGVDTAVYGRGTEVVTDVLTEGVRIFLYLEILPQDTGYFGWDTVIGVENVWGTNAQDVLVGSAADNELVGFAADDTILGLAGSDNLWGGNGDDTIEGGTGADNMHGGAGDDLYTVDNVLDLVFEHDADNSDSGGYDRVYATSSFALRSFEEELHLQGDLALEARGNNIANLIVGNDLNNRIDGLMGNDLMFGGEGDDTYFADSALDIVFEGEDAGTDLVVARTGYYLWAQVENLTLAETDIPFGIGDLLEDWFGSIFDFNVDFFGVGNDLNNEIRGNSGKNLLLGGLGDDTIYGGGDADTIFGEDGADQLHGDDGVDFLAGGAGNDYLSGGLDADALYGEAGNDTLIAGDGFVTDILVGGDGNDVLYANSGANDYDLIDGGAGDDTYYVDTGADLTFEAADGGTDTVYADVSNVPNAGVYLYANVENLVLVGETAFGVGNDLGNILTGSEAANWLLGGAGNDTLNGKAGDDVLFGEAGSDTFVFEQGTDGDVIGDFTIGQDVIDLSDFNYANFAEVKADFVQNGNVGAIILGSGDLIVLHNVTMANLDSGDFIL